MQEFNEGDLVEAVKGETVVRSRLAPSKHKCNTGELGLYFSTFASSIPFVNSDEEGRDGWTFTVIEKAAPKLPTEPGIYESKLFPLARGNAPYLLTTSGWSMEADDLDLDHMRRLVPLTRLAPVADTAKQFAERLSEVVTARIISNLYAHGTAKHILGKVDEIVAEFGATE